MNEKPPYNEASWDAGARGGLFKIDPTSFNHVLFCPKDPDVYRHHWFPDGKKEGKQFADPEINAGDVFCVRTFDGESYALLKVEAVCRDGFHVAFKFNGQRNIFYSPEFLRGGIRDDDVSAGSLR